MTELTIRVVVVGLTNDQADQIVQFVRDHLKRLPADRRPQLEVARAEREEIPYETA